MTEKRNKTRWLLPLFLLCLMLGTGKAKAQWTVIDPSNIAQSIVNNSKSLVQESQTATHMVKNFQETVKIYQQAKKYYDALQSVNNLVRDARKVHPINEALLLGRSYDEYKCKDKEGFIKEALPAVLVFACTAVIYGVVDFIHCFVQPLGFVDAIGLVLFLAVLVWYLAYTSKLKKRYFS